MQIKFTSKYSNTYLQTLRKKLSKYGVFSGPYFTVFNSVLDTFNAVKCWAKKKKNFQTQDVAA